MENGWKSIHYSDYYPFGLWYRRDCLTFIASRKRLPVSVAVQIILPAKSRIAGFRYKPAKFSNHTILCYRRIFRPEEGSTWNKRLRVPGVIHFISVSPSQGKGFHIETHWRRMPIVYTIETGINSYYATFRPSQLPAHLFPTTRFKP